jgi:hypothetical protein
VGLLAQRLRDDVDVNHGVDAGESNGSGGTGLGGGSLAGIGAAAAMAAALRCSAVRATHRTGAAAAAAVATTRAPRTPNTSLSLSLGLGGGGGSLSTTSLSAPASTATAATGHKVGVLVLPCPYTPLPFSMLACFVSFSPPLPVRCTPHPFFVSLVALPPCLIATIGGSIHMVHMIHMGWFRSNWPICSRTAPRTASASRLCAPCCSTWGPASRYGCPI